MKTQACLPQVGRASLIYLPLFSLHIFLNKTPKGVLIEIPKGVRNETPKRCPDWSAVTTRVLFRKIAKGLDKKDLLLPSMSFELNNLRLG